ncbi:hypothetical protein I4Q36_02055 [Tuanshanicoccus lijuaniae]|uniref:hypothetical protein n=1 Tax=Aerococcaceae bacterium zg-1292 TaxID=2774330 RepID=UPI00193649F6|nr:hypothetical protein [Aerococcaceae bacterium zg-1292]MBS4456324.1 hypothetical protein [Aerococcaceae bacterium zg-A91]MBS4458089.1 hypothetical protein [Aerococcaceae bacterium zg-BR33]MBS4458743.1 hypothetical protein [Aerococcaceae bacterium zg-BR33]QQA37523.1 hypothetical protein I4Q36_02055 [Aerococcaceae bacterium zg-1292]
MNEKIKVMLGNTVISEFNDDYRTILDIYQYYSKYGFSWALMHIYLFGKIQGVRKERARKNREKRGD